MSHLKRIRLELARAAGSPEGEPNYGYEFVAPVDASDRLVQRAFFHFYVSRSHRGLNFSQLIALCAARPLIELLAALRR